MFVRPSNETYFAFRLRYFAVTAFAACLLILAGCGGTQVYNSQKTLVHRGNIYNVTNVMLYSSRIDGITDSEETLDLEGVDKRKFKDLLKQYQSIFVRQVITFDEREIVYQAMRVDSWSDYRKMDRRFSSALEDLQDFLGDPEEAQLELK